MAPFNLSDFAVKEIKIPSTELRPSEDKSSTRKILYAHIIDFFVVMFMTNIVTGALKGPMKAFMTTESLRDAWADINFSPLKAFTWLTLGFAYFFFSYYMNEGQTYGMQKMKLRISMKAHSARSSLRWALKTMFLWTLLKGKEAFVAHDHLWHELVRQKEMAAPDVRTLAPATEEEVFSEAA